MPAYLKPTEFLVKDESTGNYSDINVLAERSTAQTVDAITVEGTIQISKINTVGTTHVSAVESKGEEKLTQINTVGASYLSSIGSKGEEKLTQINTAGATQVAAIENKGEETLDSIPSDYTSLANQVDSQGESINNLEANKANSDNVYSYKSKSGSIVMVDDAVAEAVKQMRIEIAPVQDLHGYDNPWPAGGGKNLLPSLLSNIKSVNTTGTWDGNEYSYSGITYKFEANSEGYVTSVNVSGTATSVTATLRVYADDTGIPAGSYIVNGCPTTGGSDTYYLRLYNKNANSGGTALIDSGSGVSVDDTYTIKRINISVSNGVALPSGGVVFKPMIRLATETDPTFAPYSNICPITGWTQANVTRTGSKDIFNATGTVPYNSSNSVVTIVNDHSITVSSLSNTTYQASKQLLSDYNLVAGKKYTLVARMKEKSATGVFRFGIRNSSNSFTAAVPSLDSETSITDNDTHILTFTYNPADHNSISFMANWDVARTDASVTYEDIHLYEGDVTEYSITFPDSAGTVYGGTLTYNEDGSVTVVVDEQKYGLLGLTFTKANSGNGRFILNITQNGKPKSAGQNTPICCSHFKWIDESGIDTTSPWVYFSSNEYLVIQTGDASMDTVDKFNTWLSNQNSGGNPVEVCYKVATASQTTVTITAPELLTMLQGYNTVYADCGNIDLLYAVRDFLTTEQVDKERIHETISTPAGVQTFSDGADNLPMKVVFGVEPVQDLHGYDNPWPYGATKNLYDPDEDYYGKGKYWNSNGGALLDNDEYYGSAKIPIKPNTQYTRNVGANADIFYDSNGNYLSNTSGKTFTTPADAAYVAFNVANDVDHLTVQLEEGASSTSFIPSKNICPISGWTGAKVTRTGKNLFNDNYEVASGTYSSIQDAFNKYKSTGKYVYGYTSNGTSYSNNNSYVAVFIPVKTGIKYIARVTNTSEANFTSVCFLDNSGNVISNSSGWITSYEHTVTGNEKYMMFSSMPNALSNYVVIETGSATTGYEDYTGKEYQISFPTSAGTVYGGTLTVNKDGSGTVVVDTGIADLGDLTWSYISNKYFQSADIVPYVKRNGGLSNNNPANAISSMYKIVAWNDSTATSGCLAIKLELEASGMISCINSNYTDAETFKTAMAGQKLVYKLATPVTYSLTPGQVKTLLGVNNIWADCGNINEVQYPADTKLYVDHQISASQRLMELIVTANHEDEMKATKAYSTGNLLIVNGTLYKATTSIANGANLTVNTNVIATTVAAELAALA